MTDRDHFAAAALTGLIASREWPIDSDEAAHYCYRVADAMLRERGNHIADAGKMVKTLGEWRAPNGCHPTAVWHELLRTKEAIKDIADDVCGVGSGVTVNSPLASDWLDAIAAEYHRVRIELSQLLEKTNHDAAPAARAEPCGKSDAQHPSAATLPQPADQGLGTGDTQEPVAWAVVYPNDEVAVIAFKRRDADERATASDRIVPLYRSPTLTDAEREAVEAALGWCDDRDTKTITTLRGLLKRLEGER